MNWRPWIVAAALMATAVANLALLASETVEPATVSKGPQYTRQYQHLKMRYSANARLANFKAFGLTDDMANKANDEATELSKSRGKILEQKLKEGSETASRVFCPGSSLPVPYGAMSVLIVEEDEVRRVIPASELSVIELQEWYGLAPVDAVYEAMEMVEKPDPESVVMGVSAILLAEEDKPIENDGLWAIGAFSGNISFESVLKDQTYKDKQIRGKVIDYFALMHLMTELANDPDKGICN